MSNGRYHWSNLSREVLFVVVHWAAAIPCAMLIFYQSWTLVAIALCTIVALLYVRFVAKMTLASAQRALVISLTGRQKATNNWFKDFIRQR